MKAENQRKRQWHQKKNQLKFKELCLPDTLSQINPQKLQQTCNNLTFLYFFSFVSLLKLYRLFNLSESVSKIENCGTYCLKLPTKAPLKV